MQIYISADIEGTCGIADWSETERKTMDDYRPFQQQMTREVAAACAGAVAALPSMFAICWKRVSFPSANMA